MAVTQSLAALTKRTIAPSSRLESSSEKVDDNLLATFVHPLSRPRLAPPTAMPPFASTALENPPAPPALAPPSAADSVSIVEAPVSSRLRIRPEKSQKWKDSMGIGPKQEKEQPKKRKAPKETQEPAKRAKTGVNDTTKITKKRVAPRSDVASSRKTKQQDSKSSR